MGMTEIIYVKLLEEGTDVWRPTMGEKVEGLRFVLRPTSNYDPRDETWEFLPGETVACEIRVINGSKELAAVRRTSR